MPLLHPACNSALCWKISRAATSPLFSFRHSPNFQLCLQFRRGPGPHAQLRLHSCSSRTSAAAPPATAGQASRDVPSSQTTASSRDSAPSFYAGMRRRGFQGEKP